METSKSTRDAKAQLGQLIQEFGPAIKRLCANYERDIGRAQDLYQDIWVEVWQSLGKFNHLSSIKTWIFRIAYNTAISHVAYETKRKFRAVDDSDQTKRFSVHESLEQKNILQKVQAFLQLQPPIDRQLFILYLEGFSHDEISKITGLTLTNISTKISRIKNRLIQEVEQDSL